MKKETLRLKTGYKRAIIRLKSGFKTRRIVIDFKPMTDELAVEAIVAINSIEAKTTAYSNKLPDPQMVRELFEEFSLIVSKTAKVHYSAGFFSKKITGSFIAKEAPGDVKAKILEMVKKKALRYIG